MRAFKRLHDFYHTHDAIAAAFNISRQAVTSWKRNGVPLKRAIEVEKKTRGAVTVMDVLKG